MSLARKCGLKFLKHQKEKYQRQMSLARKCGLKSNKKLMEKLLNGCRLRVSVD